MKLKSIFIFFAGMITTSFFSGFETAMRHIYPDSYIYIIPSAISYIVMFAFVCWIIKIEKRNDA